MIVGKRHRPGQRRGRAFALGSVLALLTLACFPVLAQADSSGVQYQDSIPTAEGNNPPTQHKDRQPVAKAAVDGGAQAGQSESSSSPSGRSSSQDGSYSKADGATSNDGGTGQGSPGSGSNGADRAPAQTGTQINDLAAQSSDDGGSSPLVPILIAIIALAAISVAAVMIRQRRQQRGPAAPASPKAS